MLSSIPWNVNFANDQHRCRDTISAVGNTTGHPQNWHIRYEKDLVTETSLRSSTLFLSAVRHRRFFRDAVYWRLVLGIATLPAFLRCMPAHGAPRLPTPARAIARFSADRPVLTSVLR